MRKNGGALEEKVGRWDEAKVEQLQKGLTMGESRKEGESSEDEKEISFNR